MDFSPARRGAAPLRVIVYGGDLAALETALTLRRVCSDRCRVMLLSPVRDLPVRTGGDGSRNGPRPARFDLGSLAAEHGLEFRSDAIVAVDDADREARTITGARMRYDALVIAFGARPRAALPGVNTCWGPADGETLDELLDLLRERAVRDVAFAAPRATRWTLPTYDLALTTAARTRELGLDGVGMTLVTYESRAVELLGDTASATIAARLEGAGIRLVTGREAVRFANRSLELHPEGAIEADRVLAMPIVEGPRIGGLPRDGEGFLPVDAFGRVQGASGIWAAGEVTSFPVRQPGIAAQQARVVAASIAAHAGADVVAEPFRPVVRGFLRSQAAGNGNGHSGPGFPLWWPPEQLAGEELSAHLGSKLAIRPPSTDDSIRVAVELGPDGRAIAATRA